MALARWRRLTVGSVAALVFSVVSAGGPASAVTTALLPYLSDGYKYEVVSRGGSTGFEAPGYDDSGWAAGAAAFGTGGGCPLDNTVKTFWPPNTDLLVRRAITLPANASNVVVSIAIDNDVYVFWNGIAIGSTVHENCATRDTLQLTVPASDLQAGSNLLAVRSVDRGGETYFDVQVTASTGPASFTPTMNGWQFGNAADPLISYDQMAHFYPASASQMYWQVGPIRTESAAGWFVYNNVFLPFYSAGLCFGMSSSATDLYNSGGAPDIFHLTTSLDSGTLNAGTVRSLVETYHSRQLGVRGARDAVDSWLRTPDYTANSATFASVRAVSASRPLVVGLGPGHDLYLTAFDYWQQLFLNVSHAVVAFGPDPSDPNRIKVYDPNHPGDLNARIELEADGGLKLLHGGTPDIGGGVVQGVDTGSPEAWVLVPLSDASFAAAGNQSWVFTGELLTIIFNAGIPLPNLQLPMPLVPFHAGPSAASQFMGTMPAASGFDGVVAAKSPGFVAGSLKAGHVVGSTETEAAAAGAHHRLQIDPASERITVSEATTPQSYDLLAGGDLSGGGAGRQLRLSGVALQPGGSVGLGTNDGVTSFTVSGFGQQAQVVRAELDQNQQRLRVQATVPFGAVATLSVYNWDSLAASLVWEDVGDGTSMTVIILQDNRDQRLAQINADLATASELMASIEPGNSFEAKLAVIRAKVAAGRLATAGNLLVAFENELAAQTGKQVPGDVAASVAKPVAEALGLIRAG